MGYSVREPFTPHGVFGPSAHYKLKHGVFGPPIYPTWGIWSVRPFYPTFLAKTWGIWSVRPFYPTNMGYLVHPPILPHKHGVFGQSVHFTPLYKQKQPILPHKHGVFGQSVRFTPHIISKNMKDSATIFVKTSSRLF
jgi:hypothetical protein